MNEFSVTIVKTICKYGLSYDSPTGFDSITFQIIINKY